MKHRSWTRRVVFPIVAAAVGSYYLWGVRAAGNQFRWGYDLGGYYDYLGRAFAHGQLHVPIEPSPKLLALPNPWDPAADDSLKMHDMAFFNGRYYLYHGAGPAVILFAPWRLATGHDLPENFALFLLCFGGFLFSCGALLRLFDLAGARPGPLQLGVMLLALGVCQTVPYLLSRVWVYEIAIGGGYFCVSGGVFFLARGMESRRSAYWLAASGLMFGLAIACRPHLAVAGAMGLAAVAISLARSRSFFSALVSPQVIAFLVPFALVGAAVAEYNYLRFGNPFEFGIRYLLTSADYNRIKLDTRYVLPGLYFNLFCPPDFSAVFPWVRTTFRFPFNSPDSPFPPGYFIEPTAGAFWLAPFIFGAVLVYARTLLQAMLAAAAFILLFLAATGFTSQRYEVDFLPLLVLVSLAGWGIHIARSKGWKRAALRAVLALGVAYSAVANLALGIAGPYNEMLKNRPGSYVRIARWFSPVERFRPVLNPNLLVEFTAEFAPHRDGFQEPLITIGYRHVIYVEHLPGRLRVVSRSDASTMTQEIEKPGPKGVRIRVAYSPESGKLTTAVDDREILAHEIGALVAVPALVAVGENRTNLHATESRFTGRIREIPVKSSRR